MNTYSKFRRHSRISIGTIIESSSFLQISLQWRLIERLTATTQLPCRVKAAKVGSVGSNLWNLCKWPCTFWIPKRFAPESRQTASLCVSQNRVSQQFIILFSILTTVGQKGWDNFGDEKYMDMFFVLLFCGNQKVVWKFLSDYF